MKTRLLIIFIILFCLKFSIQAQKYRTLEQFQTYFLENASTIDGIEGIWYVYASVYSDNIFSKQDEYTAAIIKESDGFYQYTIENGYYKPNPGYRMFTKGTQEYFCFKFDDKCNYTLISHEFTLGKNKFSYEHDVTKIYNCRSNQNIYRKVSIKYSYSRVFPLESDLIVKKVEPEKIKSTGTGFAISSNGYIVTNYHVVENANSIRVKGVNGLFSNSLSAKVILSDKNNDLAILKIDDFRFKNIGTIPYCLKTNVCKDFKCFNVHANPHLL